MPLAAARPSALSEIERLVRDIPASWQAGPFVWERRAGHRVQFCESLFLVPLDEETEEPCGPPSRVQSRDISLGGISFSHPEPVPHRKVGLSFKLPGGSAVTVVALLRWCRFTRGGRYESGGEFVRITAGA